MAARHLLSLQLLALLLGGCATGPNPRDPLENFNRKVYAFNERVDKAVLKPVARGYVAVVPALARRGVTNFFNNVDMIVTTINDGLQMKGTKVPVDVARFLTNTVFGLGGLIDVASELKIEHRYEDFGQTLGYWGSASGPYLVLPLLGPSTLRDGSGRAVDYFFSPYYYWDESSGIFWTPLVVDAVNDRANLLSAEKFLDQAALDRYAFLRDSYLQRRDYLIQDGNPARPDNEKKSKSLLELEQEDLSDEPEGKP
jgi:phospholipid-binding lipoprotein MlaA